MKASKTNCLALATLLAIASTPLLAQNHFGHDARAPDDRSESRRPMKERPKGIGHFARQNIAADTLASLSGQPREQILMQLQLAPPHRVAENLGISDEAFRTAMQAGHQQLLERSVSAGIITQQQADEIAEQLQRMRQRISARRTLQEGRQ